MKLMNTILMGTLMVAGAVAATCGAHGTPASMFVTTQWLADHQKDKGLVVLAIGAEKDYQEGHIPGSVYLDFRTIADEKSGLIMQLPDMATLTEKFAKLGVTNDSHVVLYYLTDWLSPVGRVYMTLDAMGLGAQTSLLDGHFVTWKREGRAATADVPMVTPGKLKPCEETDVIADLEYVKTHLHSEGVRIVDARDPKVYRGEAERAGPSNGHIEGAGNVWYNDLVVEGTGKLKPVEELKKMFTDAGVKPGDRVVTYCFVGQQASALYTVSRYLGYDTRLYDGSMDEWTKHPELPTEIPAKKK